MRDESKFLELILSDDQGVRDQSILAFAESFSDSELVGELDYLDNFWKETDNLYEKVRALVFLAALHRYTLPARGMCPGFAPLPGKPMEFLLKRRYEHAIRELLLIPGARSVDTFVSCLAQAYQGLALQSLADQVRRCVRSTAGNRWMFRAGHPLDYPLHIRPELLKRREGTYPSLVERTAVRMDLSHSAWSDIFFLAMDRPEMARVINVSINLCERGHDRKPRPPVEAWFRVIDDPVIRLVSVDLETERRIDNLPEIFDFGRDYLGLLKAALIASGIIPPALEGCGANLSDVLRPLVGEGRGIELASCVHNIPKGSRLAVSTNLMAALIAVCMRASGQIHNLEGSPSPSERSLLAARSILGEWLGGSGGGWQDSGGVWPGIKMIRGCLAQEGDTEYGHSRGRLLPEHEILTEEKVSREARQRLQDSLILIHGGLAQNVGPILEMVSERYLLRESTSWEARQEAVRLTGKIAEALAQGDIKRLAALTTQNFFGPIKTIIPWASNAFTEALIATVKDQLGSKYWGFWMLGGMSGGGMGLIVDPLCREEAKDLIQIILKDLKERFQTGLPFAIDPVIYDFEINENGTFAEFSPLDWPEDYYRLRLPSLLRKRPSDLKPDEQYDLNRIRNFSRSEGLAAHWLDTVLPRVGRATNSASGPSAGGSLDQLLHQNGFDPEAHEDLRQRLKAGQIGLEQNRLPAHTKIEDLQPEDISRPSGDPATRAVGEAALREGRAAVITLAGGAGSRWTHGAGTVKALNPFASFDGTYRNFLEVHLAKTRRSNRHFGPVSHTFTTSYLTDPALQGWLRRDSPADFSVFLSRGMSVGNRLIPTRRDLHFAWEVLPQPQLDDQAQKMRDSVRQALMRWADEAGEASDYRDNLPFQCMHPVGHWYEVPNLLLNGTLLKLLETQPRLEYFLLHNIDTVGAWLDPELLGLHIQSGRCLNFEIITRRIEDVGGGLARVNGRPRIVEGLALPREEDECRLSFYNTLSCWIHLPQLLAFFELTQDDLRDPGRVRQQVRRAASRLPAYITLKDVKKRWGRGQEDIFPVLQFERLWGDMSALDKVSTGFIHVPRKRGQQLKDPAQLDGWLRDGSRDHVAALLEW